MTGLPKRKGIHIPDFDYSTSGAYFITVCTANIEKIFWDRVGADRLGRGGYLSRATWFTDCATTWFTHLLLGRPPKDMLF